MKIYQLYTTFLEQPEWYEKAFQIISETEKEMVSHIQTEKQRRLSLGARVLLKYALAKENIMQYDVEKGKHGKPFLKNSNLYFNLSHSKSCVVCVVDDAEVGIDIEEKTRSLPKHYEKIVSDAEKQFLQQSKHMDQDFLRIWTMKESFVKMQGGRIFENTKDIATIEHMDFRKIWKKSDCFFGHYQEGNYLISVCAKQNTFPKTITTLTEKDITRFLQLYEG